VSVRDIIIGMPVIPKVIDEKLPEIGLLYRNDSVNALKWFPDRTRFACAGGWGACKV